MNSIAMRKHTQNRIEPVQTMCLVVDGNSHADNLCSRALPNHPFLISEALLPLIRTIALMLAAARLDFTGRTPEVLTDEADWFAARMLVLGVQQFHLDVSLLPMLQLANARAQAFATAHQLPFKPAQSKMSLHANRANNVLLVDVAWETLPVDLGLLANSLALQQQVSLQSHFCHLV